MPLTADICEAIHASAGHYEQKRAASIDALKLVQERHGWVSDEHLRDVANLLDMSAEELEGVATFYNRIFRRPVGKYVISVCDSVSCWVMGYARIKAQLEASLGIRFGQTTPDGLFTLLPNVCLGACDKAPVMMVGDDTYENLTEDMIDGILHGYRERSA